MRVVRLVALALGLGLLGLVVWQVDLAAVWSHAARIGLLGMAAVVAVYAFAFAIDTVAWQLVIVEARLNPRWWYGILKIRLVGEFVNVVVPLGGLGGEPVKALMLKRLYGIGYRAGAAALILGKMTDTIALVTFMAVALALAVSTGVLDTAAATLAGAGLGVFTLAIVVFFAVQRFRLSSLLSGWLARRWIGRRLGLPDMLHHIADVDERLVDFYVRRRGHFAGAVALGLVNWGLGAVELWLATWLLGHPLTAAEAVAIEGVTQLVRNGTFFVPANIGTQEGAFLVLFTAVAGAPELGVAVALIRRGRELIWLAWGGGMGCLYLRRPGSGLAADEQRVASLPSGPG